MPAEAVSHIPVLQVRAQASPRVQEGDGEAFRRLLGALKEVSRGRPQQADGEAGRLAGLLKHLDPELRQKLQDLGGGEEPRAAARFLAALLTGEAAEGEVGGRPPSLAPPEAVSSGPETRFATPVRGAAKGQRESPAAPRARQQKGRAGSSASCGKGGRQPSRPAADREGERTLSRDARPGPTEKTKGSPPGDTERHGLRATRSGSDHNSEGGRGANARAARRAAETHRAPRRSRSRTAVNAGARDSRDDRSAAGRDGRLPDDGPPAGRPSGEGEKGDTPARLRRSRDPGAKPHGKSGDRRRTVEAPRASRAADAGRPEGQKAGKGASPGGTRDDSQGDASRMSGPRSRPDSSSIGPAQKDPAGGSGGGQPVGAQEPASPDHAASRSGRGRRNAASVETHQHDAAARREIRRDVVEQARYLRDSSESRLKLNVNSTELGRVNVRMRSGEGRLDVQIGVQNSRARAALEGDMAGLERTLEDLHGGRAQAELHHNGEEPSRDQNSRERFSEPDGSPEGRERQVGAAPGVTQDEPRRMPDGQLNFLV